jgi:hypothetical protein
LTRVSLGRIMRGMNADSAGSKKCAMHDGSAT